MFGFMDYMIILKWLTNFEGKEYTAPSIIVNMISMFFGGGQRTPGSQDVDLMEN